MLFGSNRDFDLLVNIQREVLHDLVEQEILYYKISLEETFANIYGESLDKVWNKPVKLNCLITRGDQVITEEDFGPNLQRESSFAFIRKDLVDTNVVPEVGDIVVWHNDYYEVDVVRENQLFVGRDNSYNLSEYGDRFGSSNSIIVDCHMTERDRLNIERVR